MNFSNWKAKMLHKRTLYSSIPFIKVAVIFGCLAGLCLSANGQVAGNRAQNTSVDPPIPERLSPADVVSHISIDGTAQIRVKPTAMRLVWAVVSEAASAELCLEQMANQKLRTRQALAEIKVNEEDIQEDFISAIPRFVWEAQSMNEESVLVEKQTGFRMQTNLHVRVESNDRVAAVIDATLKSGLSDLIGVDYSADLSEARVTARRQAIEAAKSKAQLYADEVFGGELRAINILEKSLTHFPAQMYESFQNAAGQETYGGYGSNRRLISAYRPRNTYYRGVTWDADKKSYELPMQPEIIIESQVTIFYDTPNTDEDHSETKKPK